jgi:hypothetical protein
VSFHGAVVILSFVLMTVFAPVAVFLLLSEHARVRRIQEVVKEPRSCVVVTHEEWDEYLDVRQ